MSVQSTHPIAASRPSVLSALALVLTRHSRTWLHRIRCRHELSMLRPEQIRDAGLDPIEVRREASKPFWEV